MSFTPFFPSFTPQIASLISSQNIAHGRMASTAQQTATQQGPQFAMVQLQNFVMQTTPHMHHSFPSSHHMGQSANPSSFTPAPLPQFMWTPENMAAFTAFLGANGGNQAPSGSTQPHYGPHTRKYFSHAITTTMSELPTSVIKELRGGFKNYIPLAMCTHKACSYATWSTNTVDTEIAWNDKGEMRLKQKTMSAGKDYHITTDDFTEIRENFIRGMRKYLTMGEDMEPGGAMAMDCADVFSEFFSTIAARPDYTQDWPSYRGYIIESYTPWVGRRDNNYGLVFDENLFHKYKLKNIVPTILDQLRQPAALSRGSATRGNGATSSRGRGCGFWGVIIHHLPFDPPRSPSSTPILGVISAARPTLIKDTKAKLNDWSPMNKANGSTGCWETESSVSHSTLVPPVATGVLHALTPTPAPCAVISTTAVQNARPDDIFQIVTKLKVDAWELALEDAGILHEFNDILVGLRQGFLCGLENLSLARSSVPQNHYISQDKDFVVTKYSEELAIGRILHGYDSHNLFALIGHFRTAPLAVVNHGGSKCRVIVNHSFPKNEPCIDFGKLSCDKDQKYIIDPQTTSINTIIDSKKFQCAWGSFAECYLLVADAPVGTQAAVFNIDAAFRNIPTHPSARRFIAITIKGLIHLDHVLNFGASPSPGIFGRVADALVKIFLHKGVEAVIRWVDDFIFICYPSRR